MANYTIVFLLLVVTVLIYKLHIAHKTIKSISWLKKNYGKRVSEANILRNELKRIKGVTRKRKNARKKKKRMIENRGIICEYCKEAFRAEDLTVDHYIPISKGGNSTLVNLKLACEPCNTAKGDMMPDSWEKKRRA